MNKYPSPENLPLSDDYKQGFHEALVKARECIQREISGSDLTWEQPSNQEVSSLTHLLKVDTALQCTYPGQKEER